MFFELDALKYVLTYSRYFGVDINAIQKYAEKYIDIEHIRAEIRSLIYPLLFSAGSLES